MGNRIQNINNVYDKATSENYPLAKALLKIDTEIKNEVDKNKKDIANLNEQLSIPGGELLHC